MKDPLQLLPSNVPVTDQTGHITPQFFRALGLVLKTVGGWSQPEFLRPQTLAGSPFAYKADQPGQMIITGGTISALTLTRGAASIAVTSPVYLSVGDIVTVTYTVAPTVTFVPR